MKRMLLAAVAAVGLVGLTAGAASAADAVGTITVNGSVASKCTVAAGGTVGGLTFGSSFGAIGTELADSAGHLNPNWGSQPFTTNGNGNFQINCNKANPTVKIAATPMSTSGTAPTGYASIISYSAHATFKTIDALNTTGSVTVNVASGVTLAGASTSQALGSGLYLQNVGNNVVVTADTFATNGGASNILLSGDYLGTITVTITPA